MVQTQKTRMKRVVSFVKNVFSGSYSRSFYVGEGIRQEDVKASFDNSELKISVPKEAPKQVEENKFIPIE